MSLSALLLLCSAAVAAPVGWRGDGTGTAPGATPPAVLSEAPSCFSAAVPGWTNGSPVVVAGRVCTTSEPDRITCLDARTGAPRWTDRLDAARAFEGEAGVELAARLRAAEADAAEVARLRGEFSRLQREVRRAEAGAEAAARLQALGDTLASLQARVDAVAPYRPSKDLGMVGYTTPTPVSDGTNLYLLGGHGVLTSWTLDGVHRWTRWLGLPVTPMRGWNEGHASSPWLVDGVLVVPYGHLRGLDPTTGRERWQTPGVWDHYGSPAVVRVGGQPVLVTPGGDVVRVRDGAVLASGLGLVLHTGPVVDGDRVYAFGNVGDPGQGARALALRLYAEGDQVRAERLWEVVLKDVGNVGAGPVVAMGRLWAVELDGRLWSLDLTTGAATSSDVLTVAGLRSVYASPVFADGRLIVLDEGGLGAVVRLDASGGADVVDAGVVKGSRASPALEGERVYVRGEGVLRCLGR